MSININDIGQQLTKYKLQIDENTIYSITKYLENAIQNNDEYLANYLWCLRTIWHIQKGFVDAFQLISDGVYENAWTCLDKVDKALIALENQDEVETRQFQNIYGLEFIKRMIPRYQKLFPYKYFLSRGSIIKEMHCSICGQPIKIRNRCPHKVGHLYMGKMCCRVITEMEVKEISLVTDPVDKYAIAHFSDVEFNYDALKALMNIVSDPFTEWDVTITEV